MSFLDPSDNELFQQLSAQINESFDNYYKIKFGDNISSPLYGSLKNAYGHAYASAYLAYNNGATVARTYGVLKEFFTLNDEIINNSLGGTDILRGEKIALLDGSRDMWNNAKGIEYALLGKQQGLSFDAISYNIFDNVISGNDFIVDIYNDSRSWQNVKDLSDYKKELYKEFIDIGSDEVKNILNKEYEIILEFKNNSIKMRIKYLKELTKENLQELLNNLNTKNLLFGHIEVDEILTDTKNFVIKNASVLECLSKSYLMNPILTRTSDNILIDGIESSDGKFLLFDKTDKIRLNQTPVDYSPLVSEMRDIANGKEVIKTDLPIQTDIYIPKSSAAGSPTLQDVYYQYTTKPSGGGILQSIVSVVTMGIAVVTGQWWGIPLVAASSGILGSTVATIANFVELATGIFSVAAMGINKAGLLLKGFTTGAASNLVNGLIKSGVSTIDFPQLVAGVTKDLVNKLIDGGAAVADFAGFRSACILY